MKMILKEMKLGEKIRKAINNIYLNQTTAIRVNKDLKEKFKVQRGTRQGCPLSSLLFVLVLEVLLTQIQNDDQIKGVKIKSFILNTAHL